MNSTRKRVCSLRSFYQGNNHQKTPDLPLWKHNVCDHRSEKVANLKRHKKKTRFGGGATGSRLITGMVSRQGPALSYPPLSVIQIFNVMYKVQKCRKIEYTNSAFRMYEITTKKQENKKIVLEWSVDRTYPTHRRQSLTLFLYIHPKLQNTQMHKIEITKKKHKHAKTRMVSRQDPVTNSLPPYILGWSLCQRINLRSKGSAL